VKEKFQNLFDQLHDSGCLTSILDSDSVVGPLSSLIKYCNEFEAPETDIDLDKVVFTGEKAHGIGHPNFVFGYLWEKYCLEVTIFNNHINYCSVYKLREEARIVLVVEK